MKEGGWSAGEGEGCEKVLAWEMPSPEVVCWNGYIKLTGWHSRLSPLSSWHRGEMGGLFAVLVGGRGVLSLALLCLCSFMVK